MSLARTLPAQDNTAGSLVAPPKHITSTTKQHNPYETISTIIMATRIATRGNRK
jgi:hypothetical protein